MTAADEWAKGHGCRGIMSCSSSPLQAFEAGAAAERDRLLARFGEARIELLHPELAEEVSAVRWRDITDELLS